MDNIFEDIRTEVLRAQANLPEGFDESNSRNDWIAYVIAYLGRASQKVFRNEKEEQDYRENLVKAAGLIISALLAENK